MLDLLNRSYFMTINSVEWIELMFPDDIRTSQDDKLIPFITLIIDHPKKWHIYDPEIRTTIPDFSSYLTGATQDYTMLDEGVKHWATVYTNDNYVIVELSYNNCQHTNVTPVYFVREV